MWTSSSSSTFIIVSSIGTLSSLILEVRVKIYPPFEILLLQFCGALKLFCSSRRLLLHRNDVIEINLVADNQHRFIPSVHVVSLSLCSVSSLQRRHDDVVYLCVFFMKTRQTNWEYTLGLLYCSVAAAEQKQGNLSLSLSLLSTGYFWKSDANSQHDSGTWENFRQTGCRQPGFWQSTSSKQLYTLFGQFLCLPVLNKLLLFAEEEEDDSSQLGGILFL